MSRVTVIGGANTDIVGVPGNGLSMYDSNPGRVTVSAGGVGRNVAENLARLGLQVTLLTAFGDDANGRARRAECEDAGIDVRSAACPAGVPGPVYLAVLNAWGDLVVAVNDMRALEAIGPAEIAVALEGLSPQDALVLDANIGTESLTRARELMPDTALFLECVSSAKAPRLAGLLDGAAAIHANVLEATALTGEAFEQSVQGAARGADALVALGVGAAYVSAGEYGVAYATAGSRGTFGPPVDTVVNATGAGDAFMAGIVASTLAGHDPRACTGFAVACAAITLGSEDTVAPALSRDAVEARMREMLP
ncbi:MAG: PfkB family carbohydrate kinase [Anaerosomatales bacterium]|nr:PfkB family carbohydrate kinase [Anaerosomatales bacterium]MDT8433860.1 PfkB family carbohydrate kinase [Anaerosomatales bacterium]